MKIKKVLNQNTVLVDDDGREKVAFGKGIGFDKKRNDLIFNREIEQLFVLEKDGQKKLQELLSQIDERYFFATEEIIKHAQDVLSEELNSHIHIGLSDHIAFAAENIKNGIIVKNKLLKEIEAIYPEEFQLAQWAIKYLQDEFLLPFTFDEAGYITIHIHSARMGGKNNAKSIQEVTIISNIVRLIATELSLDLIDLEKSLNYTRLVSHVRGFIQRSHQNEFFYMDAEILEMVRQKYAESYAIAVKVKHLLMTRFSISVPKEELGYLAVHIERLKQKTQHFS